MGLFLKQSTKDTFAALIDIGSGSVRVALVHADSSQEHPTIVWSHQEFAPLKNIDSLTQSAKSVITALMQATMKLDSEGRKVLQAYFSGAKLTTLQCSICAPWTYTITKTIRIKKDKEFSVTEALIEELRKKAFEQVTAELKQIDELSALGLTTITHATMSITANGYLVEKPQGAEAAEIGISYSNAVTQQTLISAVKETHDKLFARTENRNISFILMLYAVTKELFPQQKNVCLIDATYEATEIGIVRDGVLQYCTHTPFGTSSLAREIAHITNVPLSEAFGYLHTHKPYAFIETLEPKTQKEVQAVFSAFVKKVSELFNETGDTLAIPRTIALHCAVASETLFIDLIKKAATKNGNTNAHVTPIARELIKKTHTSVPKQANTPKSPTAHTDTAVLVAAQFFHKHNDQFGFEYT